MGPVPELEHDFEFINKFLEDNENFNFLYRFTQAAYKLTELGGVKKLQDLYHPHFVKDLDLIDKLGNFRPKLSFFFF